jgi:protease-4
MTLAYYDYFKSIVSAGRRLSIEEVEKVAQGRVWTGEQAKEVDLVGKNVTFVNSVFLYLQ